MNEMDGVNLECGKTEWNERGSGVVVSMGAGSDEGGGRVGLELHSVALVTPCYANCKQRSFQAVADSRKQERNVKQCVIMCV